MYGRFMIGGNEAADATATAAEIARLAGVTRAAVSNWRRRRSDFPAPVGGTSASPLFSLTEVRQWLEGQRDGREVSGEVRLWQALRCAYGEDMARAWLLSGSTSGAIWKSSSTRPPERRWTGWSPTGGPPR